MHTQQCMVQCVSPSSSLPCQEHKEQGNVYSLQAVSLRKVTVWRLNQPAGLSTLQIAFFPIFQGNGIILKLEASKTLYRERACSGLLSTQPATLIKVPIKN